MELQRNRIAMVSPSRDAYSETFIQEQKNGLKGDVFYYYGGSLPSHLEHHGKLLTRSIVITNKIKRKLKTINFNDEETAFIRSLRKHKIQVVLAQYGTTAHRIVKICKYLKIPLITHFHGFDASVFEVIENCNYYKDVFEYSSKIIVVSRVMEDKFLSLGCPKDKLVYNVYGPNPTFLEIEINCESPLFIGLGRFVNKKAPYYTILAFSKVLDQYPYAKLVIGGAGELWETCQNLVRYLKIGNNVLLPGVLSRDEFIEYLKIATAFVQHSVTTISGDQEGTPVSILEASATGLPVISTIHAGIQDLIIDGETGFLVQEHDVKAMADKMIVLVENRELAIKLGQAGKQRIISFYSLQRHLNCIDKLIDDTLRNV